MKCSRYWAFLHWLRVSASRRCRGTLSTCSPWTTRATRGSPSTFSRVLAWVSSPSRCVSTCSMRRRSCASAVRLRSAGLSRPCLIQTIRGVLGVARIRDRTLGALGAGRTRGPIPEVLEAGRTRDRTLGALEAGRTRGHTLGALVVAPILARIRGALEAARTRGRTLGALEAGRTRDHTLGALEAGRTRDHTLGALVVAPILARIRRVLGAARTHGRLVQCALCPRAHSRRG